jgi:hypothetical protein
MKGLLRKAVAGTEGTRSRSASLLLTPPPPSPRGVTRLIPAHRVHRFSSLHARRPPAAMERGSGEAGAPTAAQVPAAAAAAAGGGGVVKGKSCKGCLYFSSVLRSRARGPVCVGVTRAIPEGRISRSSPPSPHPPLLFPRLSGVGFLLDFASLDPQRSLYVTGTANHAPATGSTVL